MSSFKNAYKSRQKPHRERSQPADRAQYGFLEKKKDYKLRAKDFHKKEMVIRRLQRRAENKNPDEFYFKMVNSRVEEDGVHHDKDKEAVTDDQIKLMQTQDHRYISFKRTIEAKRIEKLKSSLHLLDAADKPRNKHTFFVDTPAEVRKFNVVKHLDTVPELIGRSYNRPRVSTLKEKDFEVDEESLQVAERARQQSYLELAKRIEREKNLFVIEQKMMVKRHLANKKEAAPTPIVKETKTSAPIYKWKRERKR